MNNKTTSSAYRFASLICSVLSLVFFLSGWIRLDLGFASHTYTVFKVNSVLYEFTSIISDGTFNVVVFLLKFFSVVAVIETAFSILYAIIPLNRLSPKRLAFTSTYITAVILGLGMLYLNSEVGETVLLPAAGMILTLIFAGLATYTYGKYYSIEKECKNTPSAVKKQPQNPTVCPYCGKTVNEPSSFCPYCGAHLSGDSQE